MELTIKFSNHQAEVLLNWYETAVAKSERYGGAHISFPQEEVVLKKLRRNSVSTRYDDIDFDVLWSWMEKSVNFGEGAIYFPFEEETIEKLKRFKREVEYVRRKHNPDRDAAIREADRLLKSKYRTREELEEINKKIDKIQFKYDPELYRKKLKETRSTNDKAQSAKDLKKELEEFKKKLLNRKKTDK